MKRSLRILATLSALILAMSFVSIASAESTYSWSGKISSAPNYNAPAITPEEDIISDWICERLKQYGLDIEYEAVYLDRGEYNSLISQRLISGDAPDVFQVTSLATLEDYASQGLIKTWSEEFFRENAPHLAAMLDAGDPNGIAKGQEYLPWSLSKVSSGEMAAIPEMASASFRLVCTEYNKKWLDKLGVSEDELPRDLDSFEALMRRFATEDPNGNGEKTYGFSKSMFEAIYGAYGAIPGYWMDDGEGGLIYGTVKPGIRDALEKLAYYYAEGLIDPQFVTGEAEGGNANVSNALCYGRIGVSRLAPLQYFGTHEDFAKLDPNTEKADAANVVEAKKYQGDDVCFVVGPAIYGPNGDGGVAISNAFVGPHTVYNGTMSDEKLAACLHILDAFAVDYEMAITARMGFKGVSWEEYTKENGEISARFLPGYSGVGSVYAIGGSAMDNLYGPLDMLSEPGYRMRCEMDLSVAANEQAWAKEGVWAGYYNRLFVTIPSISEYMTDLNDMFNELVIKIVRGEADISAYDEYVEYWYANGGDIMTEDVNDWWLTVEK